MEGFKNGEGDDLFVEVAFKKKSPAEMRFRK